MSSALRLVLVLVAVGGLLRPQDVESTWTEAGAALVPQLEALATWAQKRKLFRECTRTYGLILLIEEDHPRARRVLRYSRRGKDGPWVQSSTFKEPRNSTEAALPEYGKRLRASTGPFAEAVLGALERAGPELDDDRRRDLISRLRRLDPKNAAVRKAARAIAGDGPPDEAELALARRELLQQWASEIRAGTKPAGPATQKPSETATGIPWAALLATENVRLLGTCTAKEANDCILACDMAVPLFQRTFDNKTRHRRGFTVYLLDDAGAKQTFLERYPGMKEEERTYFARLAGGWVDDWRGACTWATHPASRLDYAVRQTFTLLMLDTWRISTRQGWVFEGVGLYLTELVTGTRLTYYVKPSPYARERDPLRERLMKSQTDWYAEGLKLLTGPRKPSLDRLLTLDATTMVDEEMLYAYVLAAWLLEARADVAAAVLKDVGALDAQGEPALSSAAALKQHVGLDPEALEPHLIKWLQHRVEEK